MEIFSLHPMSHLVQKGALIVMLTYKLITCTCTYSVVVFCRKMCLTCRKLIFKEGKLVSCFSFNNNLIFNYFISPNFA